MTPYFHTHESEESRIERSDRKHWQESGWVQQDALKSSSSVNIGSNTKHTREETSNESAKPKRGTWQSDDV